MTAFASEAATETNHPFRKFRMVKTPFWLGKTTKNCIKFCVYPY